jgi:hypothetical protein
VSDDARRRYVRVLVVWTAILMSLYGFQRYFS